MNSQQRGSFAGASFLRDFDLSSSYGRSRAIRVIAGKIADKKDVLMLAGAVIALLVAGLLIVSQGFGGNNAAAATRRRDLIDAQTGEVFVGFGIGNGQSFPLTNPNTGTASLYPSEKCYWTKDGTAKAEPTYVLVNEAVGKPGKTTCPDCGRQVVPHNPEPPMELMQRAFGAAGK